MLVLFTTLKGPVESKISPFAKYKTLVALDFSLHIDTSLCDQSEIGQDIACDVTDVKSNVLVLFTTLKGPVETLVD